MFGSINVFRLVSFVIAIVAITSCSQQQDRLEQIISNGQLVVVTRNAATTYYESRNGYMGVEYEIARAFARSLGVKAVFKVKEDIAGLIGAMKTGEADIAAAGLTHTEERSKTQNFGPTYQMVAQQVVCYRGGKRPKKIEDLIGLSIKIPSHSSYAEELKQLKTKHPELDWQEVSDTDTETLLEEVWHKKIDCTIADSNIVAINRRYYPELSVRFNLTRPQPLAWILPVAGKGSDSLTTALNNWFQQYIDNGGLDEVMHRYYGYIEQFDYVEARTFQRRVKSELPKYKNDFQQAATRYKLDWTLLAAQAYQESHWKPRAKSPTGVRGMMMLTRITAKELGIKNRLDPKASILGGAYYLTKLKKRLPETVAEPDRTWLALAAYNVGMGHIWDARKLARKLGKDPDRWKELSEVLPLLTKKKYYTKLKHGYARGYEPVSYVQNIRDFRDMLETISKENSL